MGFYACAFVVTCQGSIQRWNLIPAGSWAELDWLDCRDVCLNMMEYCTYGSQIFSPQLGWKAQICLLCIHSTLGSHFTSNSSFL